MDGATMDKFHDFRFAGGVFTPLDLAARFPNGSDGATGEDRWLKSIGFHRSQAVGDQNGLSYELHECSEERAWLVLFQTAGKATYILCETWPDLIELLSKLSVIALAGVIDQGPREQGPAALCVRDTKEYRA